MEIAREESAIVLVTLFEISSLIVSFRVNSAHLNNSICDQTIHPVHNYSSPPTPTSRPTRSSIEFLLAMLMTYTRIFTTLFIHAFLCSGNWSSGGKYKNENAGEARRDGEREELSILSGFPVYSRDMSWHSPRSGMELVGSSLLMILTLLLGVGGGPI